MQPHQSPIYPTLSPSSQSTQKRSQLHLKIRQNHHQKIFKKIRTQLQIEQQNNQHLWNQLEKCVRKLEDMYRISGNVEDILENQGIVVGYVGEIRGFEDWGVGVQAGINNNNNGNNHEGNSNGNGFMRLMEYLLHVSKVIHNYMLIDNEDESSQQSYTQKQSLFAQILLPISYFLINLSSQQLPLPYLQLMSKFTVYRVYIDCYHNLFLSENLTVELKEELFGEFLRLLEIYPVFFLNNCGAFGRILWCGLGRFPQLTAEKYGNYHVRVIRMLQKIYSIIQFSTKLSESTITQYKTHSLQICSKLSQNSPKNSHQILNSTCLLKSLQKITSELRFLFSTNKGKLNQDYLEYQGVYLEALNLLVNLTYDDQVGLGVNCFFPGIWVNLGRVYERIVVQTWVLEGNGKVVLPAIFQTANFNVIVMKILKCISNFICVDQICQQFISDSTTSKLAWNEILTQIYNNHYKSQQIRVECLCILSNALIVASRQQQYQMKNQQNEVSQSQIPPQIKILNSCTDLLFQVLKLHNSNKNIILSVLKTMLHILEQNPESIKTCQIFQDHSFINRLTSIAEGGQFQNKENRIDYYSEDVRLQAQFLLEGLMIGHDK